MQDKIILGLLSFSELSLYDLRKAMEQSTAFFYNASTGSIHPALKKLEKNGWVTVRTVSQGKREKKLYARTEAGAQTFQAWISEPLKLSTIKDEAILRLFFLGHQPQDVSTQLQDYIEELTRQASVMANLQTRLEQETVPEAWQHQAWFQLRTLKFGLDYTRFCIGWMQETLDDYQAHFPI
ncbi:PadR family transcriptional regulator [Reinekea blandensis]|uniref:Transcriptional regulator n=1 Tax=Reinekea blandensis MED297 TaxID=314283 RepID=A4BBA4_9GAMM|nr:PadR family transcriptional regulator [Reinekea blandensis]EAR10717.1 hypothetical protein MED297_11895 [Reinekea sp. MED297] [Reinekea blandensis MED297]